MSNCLEDPEDIFRANDVNANTVASRIGWIGAMARPWKIRAFCSRGSLIGTRVTLPAENCAMATVVKVFEKRRRSAMGATGILVALFESTACQLGLDGTNRLHLDAPDRTWARARFSPAFFHLAKPQDSIEHITPRD
jgi:hypothetical protein